MDVRIPYISKKAVFTLYIWEAAAPLALVALLLVRYVHLFPFLNLNPTYNYETISTYLSLQTFAAEPFSWPLGVIKSYTFPFRDANIGNVGAIPLFALLYKLIYKVIGEFQFYYFFLIDLLSVLIMSFGISSIMRQLGVGSRLHIFFVQFLLIFSPYFLIKVVAYQPYCVVSWPIYILWILFVLRLKTFTVRKVLLFGLLMGSFSSLTDGYSLFGILLASSIVFLFGIVKYASEGDEDPAGIVRAGLMMTGIYFGALLSLYAIGMYPVHSLPNFNSQQFGMGGGYHVADLFSFFIPYKNGQFSYPGDSILAEFGYPVTTDILASGQYEATAYIGTSFILIGGIVVLRALKNNFRYRRGLLELYCAFPQLGLITIASSGLFFFSLGYKLHILGHDFADFTVMPAAILADAVNSIYHFRTPGRFVVLPYILFLFLSAYVFVMTLRWADWKPFYKDALIFVVLAVHLYEISPFLRPIPPNPVAYDANSENFKERVRATIGQSELLLFAYDVRAVDVALTDFTFKFANAAGLRSNIYYVARPVETNLKYVNNDRIDAMAGKFPTLWERYKINFSVISTSEISVPLNNSVTISPKRFDDYFVYNVSGVKR